MSKLNLIHRIFPFWDVRYYKAKRGQSFFKLCFASIVIPHFSDPTSQPSTPYFAEGRGTNEWLLVDYLLIQLPPPLPSFQLPLVYKLLPFAMATSLLRSVLGRSTVKSCIQPLLRTRIISRSYAMERAIPELKDKSLFIQKAYVNGEWVDAKSGKTFEVHGIVTNLR